MTTDPTTNPKYKAFHYPNLPILCASRDEGNAELLRVDVLHVHPAWSLGCTGSGSQLTTAT